MTTPSQIGRSLLRNWPLLTLPLGGCVLPGASSPSKGAPPVVQPTVIAVPLPPPEHETKLAELATPEAIIENAIRGIAHRHPSPAEMRYYRRRLIDDGWTISMVEAAIRTDHARRRFAERDLTQEARHRRIDHSDVIIERAYDDLLERQPDAEGRSRYRNLLSRGETEGAIRALIRESEEYRVTLPDSKTKRAYLEILGREPDATGLKSYRRKLVDDRWTEEDVKADLRRSAEYRSKRGERT